MHILSLSKLFTLSLLALTSSAKLVGVPDINDTPDEAVYTVTGTRVIDGMSDMLRTTLTLPFPTPTTTTSTAAKATATAGPRRCNGYVELCGRGYGNVTFVAAHNSAFVREGNIAANQDRSVRQQLDDGVRMLQVQTRIKDSELHLCHTSCDLLDAGLLLDFLLEVVSWLHENPNEVLTILLGNGDFSPGDIFVSPVVASGIFEFLHDPKNRTSIPFSAFPTLEAMISSNKRVLLFIDYLKPTSHTPTYLLEEFTYIFETPFSPTDPSFPCTADRPPKLPKSDYAKKLILANHNLNTPLALLGNEVLVPAINSLDTTNAADGPSSVGAHAQNCLREWSRPPNFLMVDYYQRGDAGVFKAAAKLNGVEFSEGSCCGGGEVAKGTGESAAEVGVKEGVGAIPIMVAVMVFLSL